VCIVCSLCVQVVVHVGASCVYCMFSMCAGGCACGCKLCVLYVSLCLGGECSQSVNRYEKTNHIT